MPDQLTPSRIVGILGGMGPAATVDFCDKLIKATPATVDQEHIRTVVWSDPTVPNRQAALLDDGEDPTPWLLEGVEKLLRCGAEILVVPCNTAHAYMPAVVAGKDVEFISIIDTAVEAVLSSYAGGKVGLLATNGALASRLYQDGLERAGLECVLLSEASQRKFTQIVRSVKAGAFGEQELQQSLDLLAELSGAGASAVIAGCTEISAILEHLDVNLAVVDPSEVLARKTVARARR